MRDDLSSAAGAAALANGQAITPAIKIDKGVPIPNREYRGGYASRLPWRQLSIGDSFIYPDAGNLRKTQCIAGAACANRKSAHGESYSIRTVTENGVRVVRVWRVA